MFVLVVKGLVATTIVSSVFVVFTFTIGISVTVVQRLIGLILADDFTALPDQFRLLDSTLLYCENFFLANTLHVCFHRAKNEVTGTGLECLVGLLADQDLAGRTLRAHTGSFVNSWPNQRELRLGLANNASNHFASVDANLDAQFLRISQLLRVHIALGTAREVGHSD